MIDWVKLVDWVCKCECGCGVDLELMSREGEKKMKKIGFYPYQTFCIPEKSK